MRRKFPEIFVSKGRNFLCFKFDFTAQIDSVITMVVSGKNFRINIAAYGESYESLDAGMAILSKDGSAIFPELGFEEHAGFSCLPILVIAKFCYLQTAIIKLCLESARAVQMLNSNPCLFWIMVHSAVESELNSHDVNLWLGNKRKDIIKELLGASVNGDEKFISKVVLLAGRQNELELLMRLAVLEEVVTSYSAWQAVPIQVLYVAERYPELNGAKFLLDWCSKHRERLGEYLVGFDETYRVARDTVRMGRLLNIKSSLDIVKACSTLKQLNELHNGWVILLNKSQQFYDPDIKFSPSRLIEIKGVRWIATANELVAEGIEMKHCVATYVEKVCRGGSYVFSVSYPERATLEVLAWNDVYVLSEIKKMNNLDVSGETLEYVKNWIASFAS